MPHSSSLPGLLLVAAVAAVLANVVNNLARDAATAAAVGRAWAHQGAIGTATYGSGAADGREPGTVGRSRRVMRGAGRLLAGTAVSAWRGDLFSEAAKTAFWQTLSLPPLLLGLLGCLGYLGDWFGPRVVSEVRHSILTFSHTVFSANVVDQIIEPTVLDMLTQGKGEVISVGFVISLWAGSSAMSAFVDAITAAHGQHRVRHAVWQRVFSLLMYLVGLVAGIIALPVLALGPQLLPRILPRAWRPTVADVIAWCYYPVLAVLLILLVATLYKLALPHKLPWYRGVPGASLAMVVFVLSSIGLRVYIASISRTGYTYGALATPIAFLLFAFFAGLAVVVGAHFNATIQRMWPAPTTRWWQRLWAWHRARTAHRPARDDPPAPPDRDGPKDRADRDAPDG